MTTASSLTPPTAIHDKTKQNREEHSHAASVVGVKELELPLKTREGHKNGIIANSINCYRADKRNLIKKKSER